MDNSTGQCIQGELSVCDWVSAHQQYSLIILLPAMDIKKKNSHGVMIFIYAKISVEDEPCSMHCSSTGETAVNKTDQVLVLM